MAGKKSFDLIDYIMSKKGLYEEAEGEGGEPIGDGTPSDENKSGELEPANTEAAPSEVKELRDWFTKQSSTKKGTPKKKNLREGKKPCLECDESKMDKNSPASPKKMTGGDDEMNEDATPTVLAKWFRLGEDSEVSSETLPEGLPPEEAKSDNQKTDVELAKEGGGQSPPAEIREARILKRKARHLREEADECECKAEKAEEIAEKDEDKKEDLEEAARLLRRKARRLREEAEEKEEKAEEIGIAAEVAAEKAVEDTKEKEDEKEDEEVDEAVNEWTSVVAKTGRRIIREQKKRKLAHELKRLFEEEEVGLGTPGQDLDAFGADDDGVPKRDAAAAPTTEEELAD